MEKLLALLKKLGAKDDEIEAVKAEVESDKEAEVEGLKKKNAELIKKSKEAKEGEGGKVAELEAKIDELTDQLSTVQKTSEKTVKALTKERDELSGKLSETAKASRDYERGIVLREQLGKLGVGKLNALDVDDAIAHIERLVTYEDVDGKSTPRITHKGADGKELKSGLAEYVEKVYPTTDHGKRFIPAGGNRGAGAVLPGVRPVVTAQGGGQQPETVKSALADALA